MKNIAWVITEDLSQHHSELMKMFRCGKEVVEILPIDLTRALLGLWIFHRLLGGGAFERPPPHDLGSWSP